MSIAMSAVRKLKLIDKVILHSLDLCLYQVSVVVDGDEHYVCDEQGALLRAHNLTLIHI